MTLHERIARPYERGVSDEGEEDYYAGAIAGIEAVIALLRDTPLKGAVIGPCPWDYANYVSDTFGVPDCQHSDKAA